MPSENCYLKATVAGRTSVKGPIPYAQLRAAFLDGKLGEHCEVMSADGVSLAEATRATAWLPVDEFFSGGSTPTRQSPKSETVESLLRQSIAFQEKQVYWARMTAIVAWVSFVLVFVFGLTFRLK
jgi:hypothetical protein